MRTLGIRSEAEAREVAANIGGKAKKRVVELSGKSRDGSAEYKGYMIEPKDLQDCITIYGEELVRELFVAMLTVKAQNELRPKAESQRTGKSEASFE